MKHPAPQVTSSVLSISRLDRSIEFYRAVFSCTITIHDPEAALLIAPGGFQIYLIARGTRAEHPSSGIGHQYLIWAVDSEADLRDLEQALRDRGDHADTHESGGGHLPGNPRPRWHPDSGGPPEPRDASPCGRRGSPLRVRKRQARRARRVHHPC